MILEVDAKIQQAEGAASAAQYNMAKELAEIRL
jgi:hypothetical protein